MNKTLIKNTKGRFISTPRKNGNCVVTLAGSYNAKYLGTNKDGQKQFTIVTD